MKNFLIIVLPVLFSIASCNHPQKKADSFVIHKGVNVSHWLSQTKLRGAERENYVTEKDFEKIKSLGFDHVRLPIDEVQFWTEDGVQNEDAFKLMTNAIDWSIKNNLRIIVDLHIIRSHYFNAESNALWTDPKAQQQFIDMWKQLSAKLKGYPNNMVAYEMMNEAVAQNPEDWNKLINWAIAEIRKVEPNRTIVMGSNWWQSPATFDVLKVPENDPNIILSFHTYKPLPFTHYKAPWNNVASYNGPIYYPGVVVDTLDLKGHEQKAIDEIMKYYGEYNKEKLAEDIMIAVAISKKYNLPLYCGEFGCFPTTPMDMRVKYYSDIMAIFNENNIAWCHWNYKNDFPLVDENGNPISDILNVLIPKK
jgi:endoglucanase